MAYICYKPHGSCPTCEHFRWDDDNQCKCCWAIYDQEHGVPSNTNDKQIKQNQQKNLNA